MILYSVRHKIKKYFKKNILPTLKKEKMRRIERHLFLTEKDRKIYHLLQENKIACTEEVAIHIKTAGNEPVYCRYNNDDHFVMHYTFFEQLHLPPAKLPKDAVILDLGSNIGLTVRHLKFLFPNSKIIGVELDKENYLLAQKNTQHLKNCTMINGAIWYQNGFVNYTGDIPQGFHCEENLAVGIGRVKAITIESLMKENNISKIDFIKMDIEGAESKIFDLDIAWLNCTNSINLEVHNHEPLDKYIEIFKSKGFSCMISKQHWSSILAYRSVFI